jgi:hypothetical protein
MDQRREADRFDKVDLFFQRCALRIIAVVIALSLALQRSVSVVVGWGTFY